MAARRRAEETPADPSAVGADGAPGEVQPPPPAAASPRRPTGRWVAVVALRLLDSQGRERRVLPGQPLPPTSDATILGFQKRGAIAPEV
jgi:hypothetical protein